MPYYVYILASRKNGTLYIGVANDITRRVWQHRQGAGSDFVRKYGVTRLVYVEPHEQIERAIRREKTMKEWPRAWKIRLIAGSNPEWDDLYGGLNGGANGSREQVPGRQRCYEAAEKYCESLWNRSRDDRHA